MPIKLVQSVCALRNASSSILWPSINSGDCGCLRPPTNTKQITNCVCSILIFTVWLVYVLCRVSGARCALGHRDTGHRRTYSHTNTHMSCFCLNHTNVIYGRPLFNWLATMFVHDERIPYLDINTQAHLPHVLKCILHVLLLLSREDGKSAIFFSMYYARRQAK